MKLYDYCKLTDEFSFDTYDSIFDSVVTIDFIDDQDIKEDFYNAFVNFLLHDVDVLEPHNRICDWTGFVKKHKSALKKFTDKFWQFSNFTNEDDFIYEWINELQLLVAGEGTDSIYQHFLNMINKE